MRLFVVLLAPIFCAGQTCDTAAGHRRLALVIGNATYANLPATPAALGDSEMMNRALSDAGFDVTLVQNAVMPALFDEQREAFLRKVQPGDVVFFYYAGHVVRDANDESLILPANFDPSVDISDDTFSVKRFIGDLSERQPGISVIMIEGPPPLGKALPGLRTGLNVPDLRGQGNILFAMSAPGREEVGVPPEGAVDRFTKAVAQRLATPGLTLRELFSQARQQVFTETNQKQLPAVDQLIAGDFCLTAPIVKPTPPPVIETHVTIQDTVPTNKKDRQEYVLIPAGTFQMGCVSGDSRCRPDEKPQHTVKISKNFWMGRTELQVEPYLRFLTTIKKKPPSAPQDYMRWHIGNLPMVMITWGQARDYCQWAGGRLPTEAEWEYAARSGRSGEIYPLNSENSRDKANFAGTQGSDHWIGVAPVHSFDANGFNLFDMAGNVWEWVNDWYQADYYNVSPSVDPQGPPAGVKHVIRGGSFESDWKEHLRLSLRWVPKWDSDLKTGFRCVLDETPATKELLGIH